MTLDVRCFLTGQTDVAFSDDARPGDLVMPAPVNAHDHGFGLRPLDFGSLDDALEVWIPGLRMRPGCDPYLDALVAFSRLAKGGVAATMHCHNSLRVDDLASECTQVVRAARDVGIRLGLACPLLDHDAWAYDGGPERLRPLMSEFDWNTLSPSIPQFAPIEEQIAAVEEVARCHSSGMVDVQYGPIGPQWCTNAMLECIAEASAVNNRRIHMHLLESPRQRQWLDRRFPQGIVKYLAEIGFLSSRLAVAHGVQLTAAEYGLLAEHGVQLVTNASANLRLRSGIAPIASASKAGLPFAIGLDGTAFDDDQDMWREMRLVSLLHGGQSLETTLTTESLFAAAIDVGAQVVGMPSRADSVLIDFARLTEDSLFDDIEVRSVLVARMTASHVRGLSVAGKVIVREGQLVNVDFKAARHELLAQSRADLPRLSRERCIASRLASAVRAYYGQW